MYVIPGNHDLLNMKTIGAAKAAEEVAAWKKAVGPDRMTFEHEGIVFIGLNSLLWNTGYPAERMQLNWLKAQLAKSKGKRILVFEHQPLFTKLPTDPNGDYYAIDNPARGEILDLLKQYKVEAVLTGHYHRSMEAFFHGTSFLTTPAISFSTGPDKGLTGYAVFTVSDGGFTHRFVDLRTTGTPPDFPNP
jgi:3',5'-cyclic AMP phosphodiesterase CpdA